MINGRKSADKNLVRRLNIALILNYLRTSHYLTRAMLAASTGLTRATVSSLVDELITLNFVRETGLQPSQGGRPGTRVELNPGGGCAIGIEIGVDFVSVVLADFVANIRWRNRVEYDTTDLDTVITIVEELADNAKARSGALGLKLLGIGVGVPGLVKIDEGLLKIAPNLRWRDIPLQAMWKERFGVPVYVANEGSAAALGEHYFGVATHYHDFIYLSTSTVGLGAGIIISGKLWQGVDGYAAEFGHVVLDPTGPLCVCGRHGCWEKVAGAQAIINYVAEAAQRGRVSSALELAGGDVRKLTPDTISAAACAGDLVAHEAMTHVVRLFGVGVLNLINAFNPQLIVVGGGLGNAFRPFLPVIENVIREQNFHALTDNVEIKLSNLGDDACVMGAIAAVLDVVLTDPVQSLSDQSIVTSS